MTTHHGDWDLSRLVLLHGLWPLKVCIGVVFVDVQGPELLGVKLRLWLFNPLGNDMKEMLCVFLFWYLLQVSDENSYPFHILLRRERWLIGSSFTQVAARWCTTKGKWSGVSSTGCGLSTASLYHSFKLEIDGRCRILLWAQIEKDRGIIISWVCAVHAV